MLVPSHLVLNQSSQGFQLTLQQKAVIALNGIIRRGGISSFQFSKKSIGTVTELQHNKPTIPKTVTITGTISVDSNQKYTYFLDIEEKDDTKKTEFENNLHQAYVALLHKPTRTIVSRAQFEKQPSPRYGAKATLELKDEGEYEILIGSPAKPPQQPITP